ncbi:uncharacterized protein HD556DRAFT_1314854 [Suillus plorans]|uniref:Uncharacterized protein n=1 Tax=Suillus plorans TaxID=116603 RepID=A0A9P7A9C1_9AGAM|nr:uncharacterized protein HD556DRAFT_1314854 [Suillus plorans]KAG1784731.1 hypothetical protein HD556DRAFT_1314854 [Suillus plorans]
MRPTIDQTTYFNAQGYALTTWNTLIFLSLSTYMDSPEDGDIHEEPLLYQPSRLPQIFVLIFKNRIPPSYTIRPSLLTDHKDLYTNLVHDSTITDTSFSHGTLASYSTCLTQMGICKRGQHGSRMDVLLAIYTFTITIASHISRSQTVGALIIDTLLPPSCTIPYFLSAQMEDNEDVQSQYDLIKVRSMPFDLNSKFLSYSTLVISLQRTIIQDSIYSPHVNQPYMDDIGSAFVWPWAFSCPNSDTSPLL